MISLNPKKSVADHFPLRYMLAWARCSTCQRRAVTKVVTEKYYPNLCDVSAGASSCAMVTSGVTMA